MLVGPGTNQPDAYVGYRGFVGCSNVQTRLKDGTLLVSFSLRVLARPSPPTPRVLSPTQLNPRKKHAFPAGSVAPSGGRAMLIRSSDSGATWSKPQNNHR